MSSGNYNPDTLQIRWETPYQQAHEWAHVEQQVRGVFLWRLRERSYGLPFIERVANLLVECEAAWLARRELRRCGVWKPEDGREAIAGLLSYALSLFNPALVRFILPSLPKSQIAHPATRTTYI